MIDRDPSKRSKATAIYHWNKGISGIHGKELREQFVIPSRIQKDLTLKQMFDISTRLVV